MGRNNKDIVEGLGFLRAVLVEEGYSVAPIDDALALLKEQEPVKHGRWEFKPDPFEFFDNIPVCTECGCTTAMRKTYNYCPNCGAKMDGGNDGQE